MMKRMIELIHNEKYYDICNLDKSPPGKDFLRRRPKIILIFLGKLGKKIVI
jgi:hypothetical protein